MPKEPGCEVFSVGKELPVECLGMTTPPFYGKTLRDLWQNEIRFVSKRLPF